MNKAKLFALAAERGIELDEHKTGYGRYFDACAPQGYVFAGHDLHILSLGSYSQGETPDWQEMANDLVLEPCPFGSDCEYCFPD